MRHHIMSMDDKYIQYIENGEKTYMGRPLEWSRGLWKQIAVKDIITFRGTNKTVNVVVTQVGCHPGDIDNVLDKFLNDGEYLKDLPDVNNIREARNKYIKWYGETKLAGGIIEIHWNVIKTVTWD